MFIMLSLLLICAISISIVAAEMDVVTYSYNKDFDLINNHDTINSCSCSQTIDSFTVSNTGSYAAVFSISTDKDLSDRVRISETSFEIAAGDSHDVFIYYNAPCTKGNDDFTITVTSNLGVSKTLSKRFIRDRCQNIELWLANAVQSIDPCQYASVTLFVKNTGTFTEDYAVTSNYDKYLKYSANSFTLLPNQIAQVNATALFSCNIYGQKNIIFKVASLKNELEATTSASINVLKNYDYDIIVNNDQSQTNNSIRQNVNVCNRLLNYQIPISISNHGVANTFKIEAKGLPKYAKISGIGDDGKFSLDAGQTKTFYIDIETDMYNMQYKSLDADLIVKPELGDIVKTKSITLNLEPCYEHTINISDDSKYSQAFRPNSEKYPLDTCSGRFYDFDVQVTNNGLFTEDMTLFTEGVPSQFSLSTNNIAINPQESKNIKLFIIGPNNNIKYNAKVVAKLSNGLYALDNLWVQAYDNTQCHLVKFEDSKFRINYQTTQVLVNVKNLGIVDSTYDVEWNGSSIITPSNDILTLNKSDDKIILLIKSANSSQGTYSGTLALIDHESGTRYSQDISIKLKDKSFITKAFEYLAFGSACRQLSIWLIAAILVVCILIIIFIMVGPNYPYKLWNRVKLKLPILLMLIAIFILGIILVLTFYGFPKTNAQIYNLTTNASQLRFEWMQNDKYVLDIGPYFQSPDNNSLAYKVSEMNNIKTIIDGNLITFYPDLGWNGTRNATVTAYDEFGDAVTSPELTLSVVAYPKKSTLELYNIYCWYTNLAILLILLIIIFLAFVVKQKKRTRK